MPFIDPFIPFLHASRSSGLAILHVYVCLPQKSEADLSYYFPARRTSSLAFRMAPRNSMLAAAGLAAGGYVATQAFVPGLSGPVVRMRLSQTCVVPRLRPLTDLAVRCPSWVWLALEPWLLDVAAWHDVLSPCLLQLQQLLLQKPLPPQREQLQPHRLWQVQLVSGA